MLKAAEQAPSLLECSPKGGQQKGFQGQVLSRGEGVSLDKDVFLLGRNLHGWPCASHCLRAALGWHLPRSVSGLGLLHSLISLDVVIGCS